MFGGNELVAANPYVALIYSFGGQGLTSYDESGVAIFNGIDLYFVVWISRFAINYYWNQLAISGHPRGRFPVIALCAAWRIIISDN